MANISCNLLYNITYDTLAQTYYLCDMKGQSLANLNNYFLHAIINILQHSALCGSIMRSKMHALFPYSFHILQASQIGTF